MTDFAPVFLLCSERSGSNLFIRLLDSHPDFCGPPPSHLIRTLALNLTRFGDIEHNDADWLHLLDICTRIMQNQLGLWQVKWTKALLEQHITERSVRAIITAIYRMESTAHGKRFCVIKENRIHLFLPYLMRAFPQARYIWVVRDPRDMALSWKQSPNHPGDVRTGAAIWQQDQEQFRHIYGYLQGSGTLHHVRYEDIIRQPETTLSTLCNFLNIPYSPAMLDFHHKEDTKANAARIANWENLAKPLLADNTGKFQTALAPEEIAYIESLCHVEMEAHGYALTAPVQPLSTTRDMLHAMMGEESLTPPLSRLDTQEQHIRQQRQAVIDQLNKAPVRLMPCA